MSGHDERRKRRPYIPEGQDDDFFDWSPDDGSPIKVDCLDRRCEVTPKIITDYPYWPWGCWFCDHLRLSETRVVGQRIMVGACDLEHPTFYYIGFRRNNLVAGNRRYVTAYRTIGEDEDVRER